MVNSSLLSTGGEAAPFSPIRICLPDFHTPCEWWWSPLFSAQVQVLWFLAGALGPRGTHGPARRKLAGTRLRGQTSLEGVCLDWHSSSSPPGTSPDFGSPLWFIALVCFCTRHGSQRSSDGKRQTGRQRYTRPTDPRRQPAAAAPCLCVLASGDDGGLSAIGLLATENPASSAGCQQPCAKDLCENIYSIYGLSSG